MRYIMYMKVKRIGDNLSILYLRCVARKLMAKLMRDIVMLSILYLRCPLDTPLDQDVAFAEFAFNSLFEMHLLEPRGDPRDHIHDFQFSI